MIQRRSYPLNKKETRTASLVGDRWQLGDMLRKKGNAGHVSVPGSGRADRSGKNGFSVDRRIVIGILTTLVVFYLYLTSNNKSYSALQIPENSATSSLSSVAGKRHLVEEEYEIGFAQAIAVDYPPIYTQKSKFQQIDVYSSKYFGKVLVLDDVLQITETDGHIYNEMMAHIPMMQHPKALKVLVIGGGDGYVLNEVLKHKGVQHVDHVDLDGDVTEVCKKHFPWGNAWSDSRSKLYIEDGAAFVAKAEDASYDVIIQDSSDPWDIDDEGNLTPLPSAVLYSQDHFKHIYRILKTNGIFNFQAETFNIPSNIKGIRDWRNQALNLGFKSVRYGSLPTTTYPTGQIGMLLCEKMPSEAAHIDDIRKRFSVMEETSFYHPRLHEGTFNLPLWVEKKIYGDSAGGFDPVDGTKPS